MCGGNAQVVSSRLGAAADKHDRLQSSALGLSSGCTLLLRASLHMLSSHDDDEELCLKLSCTCTCADRSTQSKGCCTWDC